MVNLDTKVAVLESDVDRMASLFGKMDAAIDRMGEVSNNIGRMLAVHEERLNKQDNVDKELFTLVEKRRQEIHSDIKELHSRITTVSRELSGDITETEERLMTAMTYGMSDIKKCITDEIKTINEKNNNLENRVSDLERWKWLVIGGGVVAGAFVNEMISAFFP
jgi:predicted  nucleic acid-binding Zn-ribbon protein